MEAGEDVFAQLKKDQKNDNSTQNKRKRKVTSIKRETNGSKPHHIYRNNNISSIPSAPDKSIAEILLSFAGRGITCGEFGSDNPVSGIKRPLDSIMSEVSTSECADSFRLTKRRISAKA
eukprot:CAMPEP_0172492762 /NCGR_PEP_ID=MMETSP1066-20121228/24005_1 /TAXON_ID=671091 /ORGANISM="Coscinodiscus wailesii, Strain CCMP2513" /LENGTH=118 /DNA_ID=CAMNT_0013262561 /DNA_START=258 /DNA_END=614 /DNA_ORIENTATION=+